MSFFVLGFAIPRRHGPKVKSIKAGYDKSHLLHEQIAAKASAGDSEAALRTWDSAKALAPTPMETMKPVVQILLQVKPDDLVDEVIGHFVAHRQLLSNPKNATAILDVVARAGRADLLDELNRDFRRKLNIHPAPQIYEVLLGGHASAGNEQRVAELCAEMQKGHQKLTARGYSLTIKGFLKNGMVDASLSKIQEMKQQGFFVPSFAVAQLFRTACQHDRGPQVFEATCGKLQLPADAITVLLEDCHKRNDLNLAIRIEKDAQAGKDPFPVSGYDTLLKLCVKQANVYALQLFENMQKQDVRISEGLCVGLLARCADSKFLRFAEEIEIYVRKKGGMTIAIYSAFMKVYAYCGMYGKACDLYTQIKAEGLEPDHMMYGCLMKFAVECGRTELSQELFDKAPVLDIHNYMSLIRAAGRDKDIDRAFAVLEKLKASCMAVDIAAYNCLLDACVSAGDMQRAHALVSEMRNISHLDVITYNTLLKGFCSKGDVRSAKGLLIEMEQAGLAPNDVSYNCLINAAVSSGNFQEAWSTVEMMERTGVAVDQYTLSIMLKSLKKNSVAVKDVNKTLELLDRSGVDVCSDEVLLNTALETCTRHRKLQRLEAIVSSFSTCSLHPSVHTYGSLIKACSALKCLDKCFHFWQKMVNQCALVPNDIVLGCMLDALVCNGRVEDAVSLLNEWRSKVTPNTVMYSTLIKGFANARKASRALDMFREMSQAGVKFNTVVYNALIDSQARVGAMDEVSKLVESMAPNGCAPDGISYSTIVKGYCVKGDLDKAFEVFRSMQSNGMATEAVIYNTIMDGCTRHNRMDLVDLVLEDMERYKIRPSNFTLGILVKMYGRRQDLQKAFEVVKTFPKRYGLQVNTQVRTCLMSACLNNKSADQALQVFGDIQDAEGFADTKVYGSLICGLARLGEVRKAVSLVEDAYGLSTSGGCLTSGKVCQGLPAGQTLEDEAMEQLMRALGQRRLMQTIGVPLLERLRKAQVPISSALFSSSLQKSCGS